MPLKLIFFLGAILIISFTGCQPNRESIPTDRLDLLDNWLDSHRQTPAEMVVETVANYKPLVFIQDDVRRADTIDMLKALFPLFIDIGIQKIGVSFLFVSGQQSLDMYLKDGSISVEDALLASNATLGYTEYRNLLLHLKEFPFDLVAMRLKDGSLDRDIATNLLYNEKSALWILADNATELPGPPPIAEQDGDTPGKQAPVVVSHFGPYGESLRWAGLVEYMQRKRDVRDGTFAFNPTNPPFDDWKYLSKIDTDIVMVTNFRYSAVTPIPDFIRQSNIAQAAEYFPEIQFRKETRLVAKKMNRVIRKRTRQYKEFLEHARKTVGL